MASAAVEALNRGLEPDLTNSERRIVMAVVAAVVDASELMVVISHRELAIRCAVGTKTIQRGLPKLEALGVLAREPGDEGKVGRVGLPPSRVTRLAQ